jgi:hypothetical protein
MKTKTMHKMKLACISVTAVVVLYFLTNRLLSQAEHTTSPFTIHYIETSATPNGPSVQIPGYQAARSDQSTAIAMLDGKYGTRMVRDMSARRIMVLADSLKLKSTHDYSYMPTRPLSSSKPADCRPNGEGVLLIGTEIIKGVQAFRYKRITKLANGNWDEGEAWYAPTLNCGIVQIRSSLHNIDGVVIGTFSKMPTEIAFGEPDARLFDIPQDYQEVKPSELEKVLLLTKVADRQGIDAAEKHTVPEGVQKQWELADGRYDYLKAKKMPGESLK